MMIRKQINHVEEPTIELHSSKYDMLEDAVGQDGNLMMKEQP
jgi:hypothetical protein